MYLILDKPRRILPPADITTPDLHGDVDATLLEMCRWYFLKASGKEFDVKQLSNHKHTKIRWDNGGQ